jgi:hypothetical protein
MNRRKVCLGGGLLAVAGAFLMMNWLLPLPRVTETNVLRIQEGMTLPEVEAILGHKHHLLPGGGGETSYVWVSRSGCALVCLNTLTRRVESTEYREPSDPLAEAYAQRFGYSAEPILLERVRSWLGW